MALSSRPQSSTLPLVLVLSPPPAVFTSFESHFSHRFRFVKAWESPLTTVEAQSAESLLASAMTSIAADILGRLPSLRLIVTTSAGVNHIDIPECRRRGIAVANAGTLFSADVADAAIALLLDVLRKVSAADRYLRQGRWMVEGEYPLGRKLRGNRVGIVGLGNIGLEVAKRLEPFGCTILYNSRKKKSSALYPYYPNVRDLAADSDILIICCALTNETYHMIDKEVLQALGKEGIIINIARGAVIDEGEMVQCLAQGELFGAGLDVFEKEPSVPKNLLALDNVVLSPHNAVYTREGFFALCELIVGNLEAFYSKKPLISPVIGSLLGSDLLA